jgi:hypothetical protein
MTGLLERKGMPVDRYIELTSRLGVFDMPGLDGQAPGAKDS